MSLRNVSIKSKLTLIAMLTSSIALTLSSVSFLIFDLISFRQLLGQDLSTQAKIIAYNSAAAMAFKDDSAATMTLSALTAKEDVVAAALYDNDGKLFARYSREHASAPPPVLQEYDAGFRFLEGHLEVFGEVTLHGEKLGTLFLRSNMDQWHDRANRYAGILCIFVLVSGFIAWLVSSKLQNVISKPILHLEHAMRTVSSDKNYEVRAVKYYNDEIGRLIDGFNTMLSEIQQRDGALKNRTEELEEEITHRKRTQEELLKAKQVAEEASRAKSAFLANMSHELRTPLNAIIGYSEMLEEEMVDSGRHDSVKDLRRIQSAGKHLLSLINDVLDLSKIEAGKMTLHLENFDLKPMIEEIVTTLQPAAEKNSNQLLVEVQPNLGAMRADVTKVRQILFNLLSNACKFTDHGTVMLNVERNNINGQDWVRFRVTDTGIGITLNHQRNLFQEFAQADGSIARKYGGTGLGLAISSRFVEMMNGHIRVESEPGVGSTFTVEMPAVVAVEPAELPSNAEVVEDLSKIEPDVDTILVIDDDSAVRDLMSRFLGKLGFHVIAAASGEEGLRLARKIHPKIITLDVVMPGLNGWDVLSQLKADPELRNIPVIMLTIVDNEVMGFDLGASNYLVKPIDRDRLANLLEKYRGRHSAEEMEAVGSRRN